MNVSLECKKVKRTGLFPAFFGGGILAAAIPVINMAVRSEMYLNLQGGPIQILFDANWQMMAMLNVLLVIAGACLLYHTEYADKAMEKMKSLPVRESSIFFGKAVLTIIMSFCVLVIEAGAVIFCTYHWFEAGNGFWGELCRYFGYSLLLMLPCIILSLLISEACKNMWVSLGIGVVCVFAATMLPASSFVLSLFPFAMPFQVFASTDITRPIHYIFAVIVELAVLCLAQFIFVKVRRSLE
ncbi:MAG: ABC transporter permease [bacterium]|nr:ABC transporter permease [bacterium]